MPILSLIALWWFVAGTIGIVALLGILAIGFSYHLRQRKRSSGPISPVGSDGIAITELSPSGSVLVGQALWPAYAANGEPIPKGARISVVGGRVTDQGLQVLQKS